MTHSTVPGEEIQKFGVSSITLWTRVDDHRTEKTLDFACIHSYAKKQLRMRIAQPNYEPPAPRNKFSGSIKTSRNRTVELAIIIQVTVLLISLIVQSLNNPPINLN